MSYGMSCRSTQTLSCMHGMTCHLLITSSKHPGNREAWKILFPLCIQRLRLLEILFFSSLTKILRKKLEFQIQYFFNRLKRWKRHEFPLGSVLIFEQEVICMWQGDFFIKGRCMFNWEFVVDLAINSRVSLKVHCCVCDSNTEAKMRLDMERSLNRHL